MNCRDIETLLLSERDGVLTSEQHAALEQHIAACPACRQMRGRLAETLGAYQTDAAQVVVPDIDEEWQAVRARLRGNGGKSNKKRPLAPVIWFGSTLAAAAAIAFAFFSAQPNLPSPEVFSPDNEVVAEAEFVEAGDINASTMVYVDKESGWLVVWTTDGDVNGKG